MFDPITYSVYDMPWNYTWLLVSTRTWFANKTFANREWKNIILFCSFQFINHGLYFTFQKVNIRYFFLTTNYQKNLLLKMRHTKLFYWWRFKTLGSSEQSSWSVSMRVLNSVACTHASIVLEWKNKFLKVHQSHYHKGQNSVNNLISSFCESKLEMVSSQLILFGIF